MTGTTLAEPEEPVKKDQPQALTKPQRTRVRCGCSDYSLKVMAIITFSLFIIGIAVGGGLSRSTDVGSALAICFAIVSMIIWIVMLSLLFCMSCRYPVEEA